MGFSSLDDLVTQISAGKYLRQDHSKITNPVATAGGWHCLASASGYPAGTAYPSTQDLVWQACTETHGDAAGAAKFGIPHGGNPGGTATKHVVNVGVNFVAAAGAPWQLKLVDIQGYYRMSGATVTGTGARTCINSEVVTFNDGTGYLRMVSTSDWNSGTKCQFSTAGALPIGISALTDYWLTRVTSTTYKISTTYAFFIAGTYVAYTDNGTPANTMKSYPGRYLNGVGCQAFWCVQTAVTAGAPTLSASAYDSTTSTYGAGAQAFAGTPTFGAAADGYALRILHSGNAAGRYGPFLPLASGDLGIARVNSFTWSAGTPYSGGGPVALVICRPLLDITIPVTGMWSERDMVNQLPSLPQVQDGACLAWLMFGTGATTTNSPLNGAIDFAYGG